MQQDELIEKSDESSEVIDVEVNDFKNPKAYDLALSIYSDDFSNEELKEEAEKEAKEEEKEAPDPMRSSLLEEEEFS